MKKSLLTYLTFTLLIMAASLQSGFGQTYHDLSTGSFTQDWTTTSLITLNDDWTGVLSIRGFFGADPSTTTSGTNPQTILVDFSELDVIANVANPNSNTAGGVAECEITDPVVAFQGSGSADYPNLVIYLNTTGRSDIRVQYDLRDVDGGTDNSIQQVALQYRIGTSGNFINIPAGYVADASTGPSLAVLVTHIDVTLPPECNGQSQLQVRVITSNAPSNDEWIGIDNISISSVADATAPVPAFIPANGATEVAVTTVPTITFNEPVRKTDGTPLVDGDLASLITLKKTNASGADVAYTGFIDAGKKIITISPAVALDNSQLYYLAINPVEDINGNETTASNITFTTIAAATPTITLLNPVGGETVYAGDPYTFTWTSANITNVILEGWVADQAVPRVYKWVPISGTISASTGSYNFTIPADATYGTLYKIRISDASNPALYSESGNFTLIATPTNLTDLRARCIANDIVKLNSEVTMTFKRATGNQKYIQDANAGLLIYDPSAVLTTTLAVGDNFTGLEGKISKYYETLELTPTKPTVNVTSSGNSVTIPAMTVLDYNANYATYESMLVKITNVTFPGADGSATFATTTSTPIYTVKDGINTVAFYTFKSGEGDIVGSIIPTGQYDVTALALRNNTTPEIASRTTADFQFLTGIERTSDPKTELYPVPATDLLQVLNIRNVKTYEILDATGRMIRKSNVSSDSDLNIPVNELKHGIYYIRFNTPDGRVIKKFVK